MIGGRGNIPPILVVVNIFLSKPPLGGWSCKLVPSVRASRRRDVGEGQRGEYDSPFIVGGTIPLISSLLF
jgi:hypothetical protein